MSGKMIKALKRLSNDMRALEKCPLEGIGIAPIGDDTLQFVVNIQLMDGPYQGYKLQMLMTLPQEYPPRP